MKRKDHTKSACDCSRRSFLKGAGLTLTGFGVSSLFPTPFIEHAMAGPGDANKKMLFIFLRGGNDGINTIIPHGDADYNATNRPTLYINPNDAIDLNGFASFHPALGDLMDMWNANQLAAVHRVGYPNMSRSHFDGQRVWENGDPTQPFVFDGWLYRYMRENFADGFGSLPAIGSPFGGTLVTGEETYKTDISNPDNFDYGSFAGSPERQKFRDGWRAQYEQLSRDGAFRKILSETEVKLQDSIDEYSTWDQANWNPTHPNTGDFLFPIDDATNPVDPSGPNGLRFENRFYAFFRSLKVCALSLLESTPGSLNGTRVAGSQLGSFDTHEGQGALDGEQPLLLEALAYGMNSLYIALSGQATNEPRNYTSIWNDTVLCTMSEFGRTTVENGSVGTDHGAAAAVLIAGGSVSGGVYNCDSNNWTSGVMFGPDRDLVVETDYRAVFWEILRDHMGAAPATSDIVFPGYSGLGLTELGFIT